MIEKETWNVEKKEKLIQDVCAISSKASFQKKLS